MAPAGTDETVVIRPRVCVWCCHDIEPGSWDGFEVFTRGDVLGPCCNACAVGS
jgi:hypothetical protein